MRTENCTRKGCAYSRFSLVGALPSEGMARAATIASLLLRIVEKWRAGKGKDFSSCFALNKQGALHAMHPGRVDALGGAVTHLETSLASYTSAKLMRSFCSAPRADTSSIQVAGLRSAGQGRTPGMPSKYCEGGGDRYRTGDECWSGQTGQQRAAEGSRGPAFNAGRSSDAFNAGRAGDAFKAGRSYTWTSLSARLPMGPW